MSDEPHVRLPPGMSSVEDPVDGNPFPENDIRHQAWAAATVKAAAALCRFHERWLQAAAKHPAVDLVADLVTGTFGIWANRALNTVFEESDLPGLDRWLAGYAEAWLDDIARVHPVCIEEVRVRLIAEVRHWQAEARDWIASPAVRDFVASIRVARDDFAKEDPASSAEPPPTEELWSITDSRLVYLGGGATREERQEASRQRRAVVDRYIQAGVRELRRKITRADIWRHAGYSEKSEFARWQSCASDATMTAGRNIMRVLREAPRPTASLPRR
jgi:hypothetical protein